MPVTPPANNTPQGMCSIDPTTGLVYSNGCANYRVITTAGTTTLGGNDPGGTGGGLLFGANAITQGTSWTVTPYDLVYATSGTTTTTTTNQLMATTTATAAGQFAGPGGGSLGVQFLGSLVVVTAGTPGQWNILWD